MPPKRSYSDENKISQGERSRKYQERVDLGNYIEDHGIEMSPCSFCARNDKPCLMIPDSNRCSECARRGQKCDNDALPVSSWDAFHREKARLDEEEEKTTQALAKISQEMTEKAARLARLRKQRNFLHKRAGEMLRRGLKTMDELDEAEEKERQDEIQKEKQKESGDATVATTDPDGRGAGSEPGGPSLLDPDDVFVGVAQLPPPTDPFWLDFPDIFGSPPGHV